MKQVFDAHSSFGISDASFRAILAEAEKTRMEQVHAAKLSGVKRPDDGASVRQPDASVPPWPVDKIQVRGPLEPDGELFSEKNVERADALAKEFGFRDLGDFAQRIVGKMSEDHVPMTKPVPVAQIALALLSTDGVRAAGRPKTMQKGAFDDFAVVEKRGDDGGEAVQTGNVYIRKAADADAGRLVAVGAALGRLVLADRLEASEIFAYANMRTCDVREPDDMIGTTRAILTSLRDRIESPFVAFAHDRIAALRTEGKYDTATKLEVLVNRYQDKLDGFLSRDLIAVRHVTGTAKQKKAGLSDQAVTLKAQSNRLTGWVIEKTENPLSAEALARLDCGLLSDLSKTLGMSVATLGQKVGIDIRTEADLEKNILDGERGTFVKSGLLDKVRVLRNQVEYARLLADDAEVRHQQEKALSQCAKEKDGRIRPSTYTINLGASGGILFGATTSTSVRAGAGCGYSMTINVDHAGRIRVESVKGARGEISFSAMAQGVGIGGKFEGGRLRGKELVYDSIDEFLKYSSTDLRVRLHAGGLTNFGTRLGKIERKIDNQTFKEMLHEQDVLRQGDSFMTKAVSQHVTDEIDVDRGHWTLSGRLAAGNVVGKGMARGKVTNTARTLETNTPRFANVTSKDELKGCHVVERVRNGKHTCGERLQALQDELLDFEQAVKYDAWQKSSRLYKRLNRHTASIRPPRMSLAEHLRFRVPGFHEGVKVTDRMKARFLASIAATGAAIGLEAHTGATELPNAERKRFDGVLKAFQERACQPDFKIGKLARKELLYVTAKTYLGRTVSLGADLSAKFNLHLPVINLGGADLLGGLAPGVKAACRYSFRPDAEKTGVPHLDADQLEIVIGTSGAMAERVVTGVVQAILNKSDDQSKKETASDVLSEALKPVGTYLATSPGISLVTNLVKGNLGSAATGENRFAGTNVDLGFASFNMNTGGDSGIGVRLRLVRGEDRAWKLESTQCVNYSETTVDATLASMLMPGFGIYGSASGGFGSTTVLGERIGGTSLTPLMRGAAEFRLADPKSSAAKMPAWYAFLAHNDGALKELGAAMKDGNTAAAKELFRYVSLAGELRGGAKTVGNIQEFARRLGDAKSPAERQAAATGLFRALSEASERHQRKHPVEPKRGRPEFTERDMANVRFANDLDGRIDVDLGTGEGTGLKRSDSEEVIFRV